MGGEHDLFHRIGQIQYLYVLRQCQIRIPLREIVDVVYVRFHVLTGEQMRS